MAISIVFEGCEGAGKSTQAKLLKLVLEKVCDFPVLAVREPGGTKLGILIREMLLGGEFKNMDATTRSLLYTAARNELIKTVINPFMEEYPNGILIGDRSWLSTLALQTADGDSKEYTYALNKPFMDVYPSKFFYIDILPEETRARLTLASQNGREINWRDTQSFDKFVQERKNYLDLVGKNRDRFVLVDGLYEPWSTVFRAASLTLDLMGENEVVMAAKRKLYTSQSELVDLVKEQFDLRDFDRLQKIREELGNSDIHTMQRRMRQEWEDLGFGEQTVSRIERI